MEYYALTDVGKHRSHNEDSVAVGSTENSVYAIVADGMGGHKAGEVASKIAADMLEERLKEASDKTEDIVALVKGAYIDTNSKIFEYAENNKKVMGMGTTAVSAVISGEMLVVANVGDSRAYEIENGEITQISKDHSYVQKLVDSGMITKEQAMLHPKRNYITRAMGTEEGIKVDVFVRKYKGQTILLCSDGLCGLVTDNEISEIIKSAEGLEEAAKKLVDTANQKGGTDNITVALIKG